MRFGSEVLQLRNTVIRPPLELSEALEPPQAKEKAGGNLIRHYAFSTWLPHHNAELKESQSLRTVKKRRRQKKKKSQPEETKASRSPQCASVTLKQALLKKAAELQISCREMKRKCSNQQYFGFPSGGTEAPAYEAHTNRKKAP